MQQPNDYIINLPSEDFIKEHEQFILDYLTEKVYPDNCDITDEFKKSLDKLVKEKKIDPQFLKEETSMQKEMHRTQRKNKSVSSKGVSYIVPLNTLPLLGESKAVTTISVTYPVIAAAVLLTAVSCWLLYKWVFSSSSIKKSFVYVDEVVLDDQDI